VIPFGTSQRKSLCFIISINVSGAMAQLGSDAQLLGVTHDSSLFPHKHANLVSHSCFYLVKALCYVWPLLDTKTTSLVAHSVVGSHLDLRTWQTLLLGAISSSVHKFDYIQQYSCPNGSSILLLLPTETHLDQIHWLVVQSTIHFKLATITNQAVSPCPIFIFATSSISILSFTFLVWSVLA
jgi:hypothetical protein